MGFFTYDPEDIKPGTYWKHISGHSHYQRNGNQDYVIQDRRDGDDTNRFRIHDIQGDYTHRFTGRQILEWFIPFDINFRGDAVKLTVLIARMRLQDIPVEQLQELLVKLEV
jgi:hypothetical protein